MICSRSAKWGCSPSPAGAERPPSGISVADIAAGVYAFCGILTALYQRERTGQGATLEVSLFDALGEWMGYPAYFAAYGGRATPRGSAPCHHRTLRAIPLRATVARSI